MIDLNVMPRFSSRESMDMTTGSLYESDALGKCEMDPENLEKLREIFEIWDTLDYRERALFSKEKIAQFIMENYEGSPQKPKQPFSRDLYYILAEKLKLKDLKRLGYYSSIETPLDRMGFDGFFVLDGDTRLMAGIDVTLKTENEKGENFDNSRIVIYENQMQKEGESDEEYEARIEPFAENLKEIIDEKLTLINRNTERKRYDKKAV